MITFYDLAAKEPIKTFSLNPWRTRYVLNLKKLPYKTRYLEYPDLEAASKAAGIPPNGTKPDGKPLYTSPAITDDAAGAALTDSYKIAEYLDKTYPDTPKAFPPGSEALQAAFYDTFHDAAAGAAFKFILPKVPSILNPPSAEYFYRTRTEYVGKPLEQLEPVGEERREAWAKLEAMFDKTNGWFSKSSGPYFMGDTVSFADFVVAGWLQSLKICFGEDSTEWRDIATWNNGRWAALLKDLDKYASEEN